MVNQPAILDIVKKDPTHYLIELTTPAERPTWNAGSRIWDVAIDRRALDVLCTRIAGAVDAANDDPHAPGVALDPFVRLGRGLYDCLLPAKVAGDLRKALQDLRDPLLITIDDPNVHWELMTDGGKDGLFCLRYDIGRRLRSRDVPSWVPARSREAWRCLIIADPDDTLPAARAEASVLRSWLEERGVKCGYLAGEDATFESVLDQLLEEYDIIHYAGHAVEDAVKLRDGNYNGDNIRTFVKGSPIVFLNGCVSATAVGGLADAFISAGARVVVGSTFAAPDEGAREFAETFYQGILNGRPVGEAMRLARQHVMTNPEWAAAWACFVMYGDPCLRLELKIDDLQASLRQIGLSRDDFDATSGRVVQQAVAYGMAGGSVDTAHLFAAMVGGEGSFLRERLRTRHIPPAALENAFQAAFKAQGQARTDSGLGPAPVKYSSNVQAILTLAREAARQGGQGKITELELIRSFVRQKGGGTGEVLRSLGVPVEALDPDIEATVPSTEPAPATPAEATEPVTRVGSLSEADCSPAAWRVLLAAVAFAERSASGGVGTPHLFRGLLVDPDGPLAAAMKRLRIPVQPEKAPTGGERMLGGAIPCTENVGNILLEAQAGAAADGRPITDHDLVGAFVRSGGGSVGDTLVQHGLAIEALTSELFLAGGELDFGRFDNHVRTILDTALQFAGRKGHRGLGCRHVVYGALGLADGALVRGVREQGRDAALLADLMNAEMVVGSSRRPPTAAVRTMSPHLVAVLCRAEAQAREAGQPLIDEPALLRAWLADGGGEAAAFLARNGVKLRTLLVP